MEMELIPADGHLITALTETFSDEITYRITRLKDD
jgi:hypothetical protein